MKSNLSVLIMIKLIVQLLYLINEMCSANSKLLERLKKRIRL